jgi:NAD(P)-dependent dehydrogenase (short-subunit alcohol dehydrogenase family)
MGYTAEHTVNDAIERLRRMPVALVTGVSRGIGTEMARQLEARGLHVVVNYREKAKRADTVVDKSGPVGNRLRLPVPTSATKHR